MDSIKNEKGQATIEFLVIITLVFMVIFGAVDYWIATMRIQQAEHVKNYYLDRARITGYLSADDRTALTTDMSKIGLNVKSISAPATPLVRDINNYPEINLIITTEFVKSPFMLGYFLGTTDNTEVKFSGRTFSEYVQ